MIVSKSHNLHSDQRGIVSIMMTMVIMIVISLIVLGLAAMSRREVRESLDNHLNTQAFYAAESGINDAAAEIQQYVADGNPIPAKDNCQKNNNANDYSLPYTLDSQNNVSYTCLTIDPNPNELVTSLSSSAHVILIHPVYGSVGGLRLEWTKPDGATGSVNSCPANATGHVFSPSPWSCPYGVLRLDVVDVEGGYARKPLLDNTHTLFIVPTTGATSSHSWPTADTTTFGANCDASLCTAQLNGIDGDKYYMRATEVYQSGGTLTICLNDANKPCSAATRGLTGDQVAIDSTGKAQDVLRRVSVRLDVSGDNLNRPATGAIISGNSVCKQFYTGPNGFYAPGGGCPY